VDDDRHGEGNPGAWSVSSITSSGEGEEWPEELGRRWASGEEACFVLLRNRKRDKYQ
jgi:hypothetical protein